MIITRVIIHSMSFIQSECCDLTELKAEFMR